MTPKNSKSTTVLPDDEVLAGAEPSVADFAARRSVKREILDELRAGWDDGQPATPEDLLARWPGNPDADPDVASLLFQDYCQRRQSGEQATPEEYDYRFPSLKGSVTNLCNQQGLLRSLGGGKLSSTFMLALPAVNDEVFGFRLRRELGRGSFARVFLAEQAELAGRPVVVKVSAIDGDEPQTLAQLQHTHIVPIYSVHEDNRAGLRVVCMPYFGGASLSRILQRLWAAKQTPKRGEQVVEALAEITALATPGFADQVGATTQESESASPADCLQENSPLAVLGSLDYARASAWIIARLAEALQHAHQRGVLHRDLKPSNILLGSDGQPMLLDFNLAQSLGGNAQATATLGGTVAYMAPEHLRALAGRDPALIRQVDERADIYGLGMVLYEMLTGRRPFDQSASYSPIPALIEAMAVERARHAPSPRAHRHDIPWSLESIARKCLAADPKQRYQQAEHLATDLRCFLEDRPLQYAPELSWKERLGKWVRRHPRLAATGSVATAAAFLLGMAAAILLGTYEQLRAARLRTYEAEGAEARERQRDFSSAAERARCLANTQTDYSDHLADAVAACEKALGYYDVLDQDDWQQHPTWQRLDREEQRLVSEDVRELLLLVARAEMRHAGSHVIGLLPAVAGVLPPPAAAPLPSFLASWTAAERVWKPKAEALEYENATAGRKALALLDKADAIAGLEASRALWLDRAAYRKQLGDPQGASTAYDKADKTPLASAHDHYMVATLYAHNLDYASALAELKQALKLNPRHYWSHFMLGICYFQLRDYTQAVASTDVCIALWPEAVWGRFNHGRALQQLGKNVEAIEDYDAILERDPGFVDAHINRGLAYLNQNKPLEALADFDAAISRGSNHVVVHALRGIALEGLGRPAEADAAFERAWQRDPDNVDMLLGYGFAVWRRLPDEAKSAFTKVLARQPQNPRALYGYAMLLAQQERGSQAALACFTLALDADPAFIAARRGRANVLAHRGEWERAREDMDWCVKVEPTGVTLYAAACVYALMADKCPEHMSEPLVHRALVLLREALEQGYGQDKFRDDSDLAAIRQHPEFRKLLRRHETASSRVRS
jgi:serine/threonine protein kinase/Tfp pilus assembly protein PilF